MRKGARRNKRNNEKLQSSVFHKRFFHSHWMKLVAVMAVIVAFYTVRALVLPASAVDEENAVEEEGFYLQKMDTQADAAPAVEDVEVPAPQDTDGTVAETGTNKSQEAQSESSANDAGDGTEGDVPSTGANSATETNVVSDTVESGTSDIVGQVDVLNPDNTSVANTETGSDETTTDNSTTGSTTSDPALTEDSDLLDEEDEEQADELATEALTEELDTEKEREEIVYATSLTADNDSNLYAEISMSEDAQIPEDTVFEVHAADNAKDYLTHALDLIWGDDAQIAETEYSDFVTFTLRDEDGEIITPADGADFDVRVVFRGDSADLSSTDEHRVKAVTFADNSSDAVSKLDASWSNTDSGISLSYTTSRLDAVGLVVSSAVKEEESKWLSGSLEFRGSDYHVTIAFDEDAQIPEGSKLSVKEIGNGTDGYSEYVDQATEAAQDAANSDEGKETKVDKENIRLFDITILNDGKEVEPQAAVDVKISLNDRKVLDEDSQVVHFPDEDAEPEVLDSSTTGDAVQFKTDSFSVYAIVKMDVITTEYLSHDGYRYEITVTYGADARIPEGSTLSVTEYETGSDKYEYDRKAVLAAKKADGENISSDDMGFVALDISILDPDGKEIEPSAAVKVDFRIKSLPDVHNLADVADTIEIQHHIEMDSGVVVDTVFDGGSSDAAFEVPTDKDAIAKGTVVDPNTYVAEDDNTELDEEFNASFTTEVFSDYTISWRTGYTTYNYTIHYVDANGHSLTPTREPSFTNGNSYLIYDIEGYEYESTHLDNTNGTSIQPWLTFYEWNQECRYYDRDGGGHNLRNDVYVVYKEKTTPTSGGTPEVGQDEDWPESKPLFTKSSTNNGNGTNKISLTISGAEKTVEKTTPADVIVVFDVSGSMDNRMNDGKTRLAHAKEAVDRMADELLSSSSSDVQMSLITFSTTATTVQEFTKDANTFKSQVDRLRANGGTNWEGALQLANQMQVRQNAATYVVFVTDGDPTFRVSRGDVSDRDLANDINARYYRDNHVFGTGDNDASGRNFDFAVDQVTAIHDANKSFYTIGISNDVNKVQNLTTQGGFPAEHAFLAADSDAMDKAFQSITESIQSTLGFGNVKIVDGITNLTNAEMKVLQTVDPESFTYYRYGGENNKYGADYEHRTEWSTREADGCAAASYNASAGTVDWNMGEHFQLEDGVTYVVEFTVWPSQSAYDLVADLSNGLKSYDSLTEAEKEQIIQGKAGEYALKTNTDEVNATYNKTTEAGDTVAVSDTTDITAVYHENIENMSLASEHISITKKWNNDVDSSSYAEGITLTMTKDGEPYKSVELSPDKNWVSAEQHISAGMITKNTDGTYRVRETGHEYTLTEPESFSDAWDLTAPIYRPMVIDGAMVILVKTDVTTGTDGTNYYVIDDKRYQVANSGANSLTAVNDRRSRLDLKKIVTRDDNAADQPDVDETFTYTITITDSESDSIRFNAVDGNDKVSAIPKVSQNITPEIDNNGQPTGYYSVPSGQQFEIAIKANWNVHFINLPTGTTYSITETDTGDGFNFLRAETRTNNGGAPGAVNGSTVTGIIDKANNDFDVEFTNQWLSRPIKIVKVDENGNKLAGATFSFTKGLESVGTGSFITNSDDGETYYVGKGIYCLTETGAPSGYIILENEVFFEVDANGNIQLKKEVKATGADGTEIITYEDATSEDYTNASVDGSTITITNQPGKELPMTGGSGTLPYTLGGTVLAITALMYGFIMRRQRERRSYR
jgi:LPXTG-motif cell wall-anchored protein